MNIKDLLKEMWSDGEIAHGYHLEEKKNWTPVYRYLARLFLLVGYAIGVVAGCGWGYLLCEVIKH